MREIRIIRDKLSIEKIRLDTSLAICYTRIMPKPLSVSGYPKHILDIADKIGKGENVTIKDFRKDVLSAMRFDFYGFRKAVEREEAEKMFPNLKSITVSIKPSPPHWVLSFENMDTTYAAMLVAEQLGTSIETQFSPEVQTPIAEEKIEVPKSSPHIEDIVERLYGKKKT